MAEENILKVLKDLHISYEIQEHIPLFSEKDAQNVEISFYFGIIFRYYRIFYYVENVISVKKK